MKRVILCGVLILFSVPLLAGEEDEFVKALKLSYEGKYDRSNEIVLRWVRMVPADDNDYNYYWWHYILSLNMYGKDNFDEAIANALKIKKYFSAIYKRLPLKNNYGSVQSIEEIKRTYRNILYVLSNSEFLLKKYDDAMADYNEFVAIAPPDPDIYSRLAICYYFAGKYKSTEVWFEKAYALLSDDNDEKFTTAFNLAAIKAKQADSSGSIVWLKKIFKANKDKSIWLKKIESESDFDPIRGNHEFVGFIQSVR